MTSKITFYTNSTLYNVTIKTTEGETLPIPPLSSIKIKGEIKKTIWNL